MTNVVNEFLGKLKKVGTRSDGGWMACCPAHDDKNPSLSVRGGDQGQVVFHCFAGCSQESILTALQMTWEDVFAAEVPKVKVGAVHAPVPRQEVSQREDHLHNLYARVLKGLVLSAGDEHSLLGERGLTSESLDDYWLRTSTGKIDGLPAGLVIPIWSKTNRIVGLQVRTGLPDKKYCWASVEGEKVGAPAFWTHAPRGQDKEVRITEGALKAIRAVESDGVLTIGLSGVDTWDRIVRDVLALRPGQVRVAFDSDWRANSGVRRALIGLVSTLQDLGAYTVLEVWSDKNKGIDDAIQAGEEIKIVHNPLAWISEQSGEALVQDDGTWDVCTRASQMVPKRMDWLWQDWLPAGAITVLDGDPGIGKSQLSCMMVSGVTRKGGDVIIMAAEDDPERVQIPRLMACGADLDRVHLFRFIRDKDGRRLPAFPDDLERLGNAIYRTKAKLVIIDPLFAYLGEGVDPNNDVHLRKVLSPLSSLAEQTGTAVLILRHLNKSGSGPVIYRGGGTIGISAAARVVWIAGKHPDESKGSFILACSKTNHTAKPKSREYSLEGVKLGDIETSRVRMAGEVDVSAESLAGDSAKRTKPKPPDESEALTWLQALIEKKGRVSSTELEAAAQKAGHNYSKLVKIATERLFAFGIIKEGGDYRGTKEQGEGEASRKQGDGDSLFKRV